MLKIRMQRTGRINNPSYRIVVVEHTRAPQAGNFVERVGTYNPKTKEKNLNADRIKYWMSVGAKPSDTMHNMFVSEGIISGKKINVLPTMEVPKEEPVAETPVVSAPAAEEITEAPVEPEATETEEVAVEVPADQAAPAIEAPTE